jgi:hypothetical protein
MALYEITIDPLAKGADQDPPYRIKRRLSKLGVIHHLVDVSPTLAAAIGTLPAVIKIEPALDGDYLDDNAEPFAVKDGRISES